MKESTPQCLPPDDDVIEPFHAGPYRGWLTPPYTHDSALQDWLGTLSQALDTGEEMKRGRHRVVQLTWNEQAVVVKAFGQQSEWKDHIDQRRGSKAYRSFRAACHIQRHGLGTPAPIACLERWQNNRLQESYFISRHEDHLSSFREELIQLYRHEPHCDRIMNLMLVVARSIASLHDAGALHGDLGNQNILLRRKGTADWGDVMFIDLNRMRFTPRPSWRQRALDMSRIHLPSDFLRVFKAMYFGDTPVPQEFDRWEDRYRRRFNRHTTSRAWRHPIRTAKQRKQPRDPKYVYPATRDLWIWDERSGQAISTLMRREKKQHYPRANAVRIAAATARMLLPARRAYHQLAQSSFSQPVAMSGRFGITVHPRSETWQQEREWLDQLGPCPVLLRFYHHEEDAQWQFLIDRVHELSAAGYPVSLAMVQDRRAVLDPSRWQHFVRGVLDPLRSVAEWVEIGHTINRVKWGVWTLDEYARLCEPFCTYANGAASFRLMGPAAIDFEYQYVAAALRRLTDVLPLDALSHHLYVDRRGAPENQQSGFSSVEKAALAKALATVTPHCANRLIISEVNWPLAGTGVYSPVGSPYEMPGPRSHDPSVTEDIYADYMVRYYLLTLCSGHAERVYWWRLAAHGFGLIDDRAGTEWRARPAFWMLQHLLHTLGDSRFIQRRVDGDGIHTFEFERQDHERIVIAYAHPRPASWRIPASYADIQDATGKSLAHTGPLFDLTGRPVYVRGWSA